jgi:hypothetical protein
MAFAWYASDDTTPAGTAYTLTTTAGTASSAIELHAWLNKGSSVGTAETRFLRVYVEDPASPGTYKLSGLDALDRREFEVRIIGSQNPDLVPGFSVSTTAWTPIGTDRGFQLPAIYPNCAIEIEVRVNPTNEGGSSTPATFYIKAVQGNTPAGMVSIPDDVTVDGTLDMGTERITGLPIPTTTSDGTDAVPMTYVRGLPYKSPVRLCATAEVAWFEIDSSPFASDLEGWAGTNWAWDTGTALHTAGAAAALSKSMTIVSGVRYKVSLDVGGTTGTVTPSIGAVAGTAIAAGAGGVTQIIVAAASGSLAVSFTPTSAFDGTIDNVVVTATLYGAAGVDGETSATNDRILLPLQTDPAENGKWIASDTGPWTRHPDCAAAYYLYAGCVVWVREGTANLKSLWVQTEDISDIETDAQTWALVYQVP